MVTQYPHKYKVYTALLNQSGTDAPVATVLENTLDKDIYLTYNGVGTYELVSDAGAFILGKTFLSINKPFYITRSADIYTNNANIIYINIYDLGLEANDAMEGSVNIEIRVYN